MENLFTFIIINVFILLVIGLFNAQASLFWLQNHQTKLKSFLIYSFLLLIFLALFGLYTRVDDTSVDESTDVFYEESSESRILASDTITSETPKNQDAINDEKNLDELINAVDIKNEITNDFAVRLASRFPGEYNIGQVCNIYNYIVQNWKYVNDSDKMENFRSASRSIRNNLSGDCDDFAILLAAMVESIGGDARISFAYNEEDGHAFTEVLATNQEEYMPLITNEINALYDNYFTVHYTKDSEGKCWLNLDWFGTPQYPGGKYFEYDTRTIFYPTHRLPYYTKEQNRENY